MRSVSRGFTLIEISIVLVIVGLLAGAILKGQQMIENAKYKAFVKEIDSIRTAIATFQDQYKYLPGDFPRADSKLYAPGITILNGNGDGQITWGSCDSAGEDSCLVWQHLIAAGLLTGDASLVLPTESQRATAVGGFYKNVATGAWSTGRIALILITVNIPGNFAQRLDDEFDDGKAISGKIACHSGTASNNWSASDCLVPGPLGSPGPNGEYLADKNYMLIIEL